jgi:thymidylate synthase
MFNIILATDINNGIGYNDTIPWKSRLDQLYFRDITTNCIVKKVIIMGRKTFDSIKTPLPGRYNIVISTQLNTSEKNLYYVQSFNQALSLAYELVGTDPNNVWVCGGSTIYNIAFNHIDLNLIYHTKINLSSQSDTYCIVPNGEIISQKIMKCPINITSFNYLDMVDHTFNVIKKYKNAEELYLNLLNTVLKEGHKRETRNGITHSLFGKELVFNVTNEFPLLTTKKMFLKGIVEELLFFIRGDTDTNKLVEKGINIWQGNTTREFLDKMNLDYNVGDMGPMYGYQWRFFGKPYQGEGPYVDQLTNLMNEIKTNPHSRRLIITTFNPAMVDMGVLYPCHSIVLQFYINENKLSVKMYQRSADLFLGLPFNIASTSLLLYIVAKLTNMIPDMVHITLGDCHIYEQHIDSVKLQLSKTLYSLPTLTIPDFTTLEQVEKSKYSDYVLNNYISHEPIKVQMIA